jgi:hypothetical protein
MNHRWLELNGELYDIELELFTASGYYRENRAYICPGCLKTWAKFLNRANHQVHYQLSPMVCEDCPSLASPIIQPVPGSLISDWTGCGGYDYEMLAALPEALLRREFELTMRACEQIWIPQYHQRQTLSSRVTQEPGKPTF